MATANTAGFPPATAFTIHETTGLQRTLRLAERALPYQGVAFPVSTRADIQWFPGSPTATIQMLGPQEGETSVNGMWKQRFLSGVGGQSPATLIGAQGVTLLETPFDIAQAVRDFVRQGQLLEVTWDRFVRVGIIKEFTPRAIRPQDYEWEITFSWTGDSANPPPNATAASNPSLSDVWGDLTVKTAVVKADFDDPLVQEFTLLDVQQAIKSALTDMDNANAQLQTAIDNLTVGVATPFAATRHAVSACFSLADTAIVGASLFQRAMTVQTAPLAVPDFGADLAYLVACRRGVTACRALDRAAVENAYALGQTTNNTTPEIYIAREGDDLRDVSRAVYGTIAQWQTLMVYNQLSTSELTAGQRITCPPLQSMANA